MNANFIILILIICICGHTRTMEENLHESADFYFNVIIKRKNNLEFNKDKNLAESLNKKITSIACSTSIRLNKLASNYSNLIFLLPREIPSLTVTFQGTVNENTNLIEWDHKFKYKRYFELFEAEMPQFENFNSELKSIIFDAKAQLQNLIDLYTFKSEKHSFIKLKIQLHLQESVEDPECILYDQLIHFFDYCSPLYNVYRW